MLRRLMLGFGLALAFLTLAASPARKPLVGPFGLELDPSDPATPEQRARIEQFFNEVTRSLPRRLREVLNRKVTVKFEALDAAPGIFIPPCIGAEPRDDWESQILGQVTLPSQSRRREIDELSIHQGFKAEILAGESQARTYSCGHKNLYRLALASVIHELGHIYDYADPRTPEELRFLRTCEIADGSGADPDCLRLRDRHTVTTQKSFLDLMGWVETGNIFYRSRKQENQSSLRSPDPYEFTHPRESFSVNLEYFLLDPEYACRRPAVHRYYSSHFEEDPHPGRACRMRTALPLSTGLVGGPVMVTELDPARVYQIHALFAGEGPATMSRWGHSMYRIVLCAPDRQAPGPECMNDLAHHVALGFRANVPDSAISYFKGLTGGYSSLLYAQPFLSVIEEYNKGEFRELVSLPLKLSEAQKDFFIERVLEASWEYSGRYRFINNNCATEALNFLKGVLGETRLSTWYPATPVGLHETLQKLEVADASVLQDKGSAIEGGYFFASKKPEVDLAYGGLLDAIEATCGKKCRRSLPRNAEEYLDETQSTYRREIYESLWNERAVAAGLTRKVMGARFFLLESYLLRRSELSLMQRVAGALEGGVDDGLSLDDRKLAPRMRKLLERLRALQQLKLPSQIQSEGYGIPLHDFDSEPGPDTEPSPLLEEEKSLTEQVVAWAASAFKGTFTELESTRNNRLYFLKEMRKP